MTPPPEKIGSGEYPPALQPLFEEIQRQHTAAQREAAARANRPTARILRRIAPRLHAELTRDTDPLRRQIDSINFQTARCRAITTENRIVVQVPLGVISTIDTGARTQTSFNIKPPDEMVKKYRDQMMIGPDGKVGFKNQKEVDAFFDEKVPNLIRENMRQIPELQYKLASGIGIFSNKVVTDPFADFNTLCLCLAENEFLDQIAGKSGVPNLERMAIKLLDQLTLVDDRTKGLVDSARKALEAGRGNVTFRNIKTVGGSAQEYGVALQIATPIPSGGQAKLSDS